MTSIAPYRADEVGSLLRPPGLKNARQQYAEGRLDADALKEVENSCIREVIAMQEKVGLLAVTDGEFRRSWWHFDFLAGLDGVELVKTNESIPFQGASTKHENVAVTGEVAFENHFMLEHFRFLAANTNVTPKISIPAPSVLHFRGGRDAISKDIYPDWDKFYSDTAEAYAEAVKQFYSAGCRYLQFDDTVWAYLCSEKERAAARERGLDPDSLQGAYRDMINHALREKPKDMKITTHVCRGNFRSTWISEGGYEPVAKTLLQETAYDGYFLEYDTDRAGDFAPLRFLPKGEQRVVLGLVTSKSGELESKDLIRERIEEACEYVALEQFCLSPQCGFASTEEGNILSEEEQWKKLGMIVDLAREVWGEL